MFFLIIELIFGSWQFSTVVCTSYLVFDSMNKFVAPIIVFLISRTCYTTVCLEKSKGERAASLKYAILQVAFSLCCVMLLLWPVFAYSQVFTFHLKPNNITQEVTVMRKCGFFPPPQIEFWFNLVACFTSYAVPLFGIIYWYVSVPFFLKRRALTTLVASRNIPSMANVTVRCRISSFVSSHQNEKDEREEEKADQEIPLKPHHLTPTAGVSVPVSVLDVRGSLSSMDLNESETLL
uniref:G_PROTEIN_RECEP_F1_2 domain-containing protein n=1 Tax=Heterorhabditis bacteriophora TaxID=37862 RepID=A0A1I7XK01_HETBA